MSDNPSQILEATEGFVAEIAGERYLVNTGTTRISADHVLAKHYPQHFRPIEDSLSYRTEEATAEPGVPRDRAQPAQAAPQPEKPAEKVAEKVPSSPSPAKKES